MHPATALIQAYAVGASAVWQLWGSNDPTFATETQVYPPTSGADVTLNVYNSGPYQWDSLKLYGNGAISGPLNVGVTPVRYNYYRVKAKDAVSGTHAFVEVIFATFGHYFGAAITGVTDCNHATMSHATTSGLTYGTYLPGISNSFFATDDTNAFEMAEMPCVPMSRRSMGTFWCRLARLS